MSRPTLALLVAVALAAPARAGTSSSLMDISADGARIALANTDSGTVSVLDTKSRTKLWETAVGDHPEGVAIVPGGSTILVTVYGDDCVRVLDAATGRITRTIPVADEPYGVVVTPDAKTAYVSHDYPGTVSEIDVASGEVRRTFSAIKPGVGCRGLALSNDGKSLYATEFFTAALVKIDIASGEISDRFAGDVQDNLARHVVLHPKRGKAYLSHTRDRTSAHDARGSVFPQLSFCDLDAPKSGDGKEKRRRSIPLDTFNGVYVVTNPWEAAVSPDGTKLYTIYAGTNDANVSKVIDDDYEELDRIGRAVTVGKHPKAVRVSPDGNEVYIYATLDHAVVVYSADLRKKLGTIDACTPANTAEWRRGKELFETALDPMGSARWIACSSCHPDGLHDGRVWQNAEGMRKTPNLFGMAHTYPAHWSGDRDEGQDFEYTIRGKLMQGRGLSRAELKPRDSLTEFAELEQVTAGKSRDLDALAVYTNSFGFRLSPHIAGPGKLTPEAQRGQALFHSAEVGCASCHSGPYYTDSRVEKPYNRHDVGTGDAKDEKVGPNYDTPTLLGVYRVNSYLHDGRASTLEEVFTKHNAGDKHGKTSHLSLSQVGDLAAFVKSLPFEPPPAVTPNTTKYRLKPGEHGSNPRP